MTVKAWFTISALVLVALAAAVIVRFLAPVDPPPIFVRAGDVRLVGVLNEGCWPQRGSDLRCKEGPDERPSTGTLPAKGQLRVVVAYPAQPDDGSGTITITGSSGDEVLDEKWDESIDYELESGSYTLTADARYPAEAFVRYVFRFRVR